MSASKRAQNKPRIFTAQKSSAVEPYDLFGEKRQWLECITTLNAYHKDILKTIEYSCIRLINEHECKLELSSFSQAEVVADSVKNTDDNNTNLIWLQATNELGHQVVLAISYTTLYRLTELFLGGLQSNIASAKLCTEISDSELRLLERLLTLHLDAFAAHLSFDFSWKIRLIDPPTNQVMLTACACLTISEFQALWQIWLPKELIINPPHPALSVDEHGQLAEKLNHAAQHIPTVLDVVLAKTQISLAQLTQLKSGDTLAIEWSETVHAFAGEQVVAQGKIVDKNGHLALQVTEEQPLTF